MLFTGDTIFHGGVGRFFEGTAEDMYKIFNETFYTLPQDTLCFYAHEYAVDNFAFAKYIDPQNEVYTSFEQAAAEAKKAN